MILKKHTLAISIALSLGLTACSGGGNQSNPVTSGNTAVSKQQNDNNQDQSGGTSNSGNNNGGSTNENSDSTARNKLETSMDPEGKIKWRQLEKFIPANETSATNPLQASQNGKISPQQGAAAYLNGPSNYLDGSVKSFRNDADRTSTNYNPEFMTTAAIDPNQVQTLDILNKEGNSVAKIHFANQEYSSYSVWKSTKIPTISGNADDTVMTGYVAVPTKPDTDLSSKGQVTYRGHTLAQSAPNSTAIHFGNIELNADFGTKKISGKLTNRNDMLLDSSIARYFPEVYEIYTTDPDDLDYDPNLKLISAEEYAKKEAEHEQDLAAEKAKFRTIDVTIKETDIKSGNGVISFSNPLGALSYTNAGKTRETGVIGGIFAGKNGQEVVGEIQGSDKFMSFGATEEKK